MRKCTVTVAVLITHLAFEEDTKDKQVCNYIYLFHHNYTLLILSMTGNLLRSALVLISTF